MRQVSADLNVARTTLYRWVREYGIEVKTIRAANGEPDRATIRSMVHSSSDSTS